MKKKLLGVLLSLAMALNFTVVSAFAVEKPTITVETDANAVEAGDTVDLSVSITGNTGFTNYEWNIQYDKDRLELITIKSNLDIVANPNHPQTGFGYASCARANSYSEDAELFTLTFTVKEDAKTGNAEVKIESDNFKNNGVAIDADYVVGGVTVNGSTTGGSTTGGSTAGGSTTGGSTTGGSTTGGSTTGGSTTGGSTTGGSTTGGSTTGGSTTGGSTTGGSTTGGSTTGGSTTGGSTTGGSTTGGSTTGGSTTGGSTTGGSTTGGSTTGGSTTGGSTTGGSSSGSTTYTVKVLDSKNGDVTASHKTASKGTAVTLTVTPDKGYVLDTLTVLDGNNKDLKLTEKNGKFTFTMPASKVTVAATFKASAPTGKNPFIDVPSGSYYEDAVVWAVEKGITSGTSAVTFDPSGNCTRAQAVTFLWRAAGSPAPKTKVMPFTDVPSGSYYYDAVLWAMEQGITKGTSDTAFSPNASCTRAQIVTFLWRANGSPAVSGNSAFTDVAADAYYAAAVAWAEKNGVTGGIGNGLFGSGDTCTRAQIVTFLYRAMK